MITGPELFILGLIALAIALFIWDRVAPDLVAIGLLLVLVFSGILEIDEALRGFANPALLAVAALFVVSEGVIRTGAVGYLGAVIGALSGGKPLRLLLVTAVLVGVCSAFLNNTPVVLLFVPIMLGLAEKYGLSPSKLLIPVSYISVLGGTCTLLGTSTNLLVNSFAEGQGGVAFEPLRMFEFLPLGLVFFAVGLIYLMFLSFRMLPERRTVATLTSHGGLTEYVTEIRFTKGSRSLGKTVRAGVLKRHPELKVVELVRGERIIWAPDDEVLEPGDILIVMGTVRRVAELSNRNDVEILPELTDLDGEVHTAETTLAELVIPPNSSYVGRTLEAIGFHRRHGVGVIAIQRHGFHFRKKITEIQLRVGDVLLVQGEIENIHNLADRREFLLLEGAGVPEVNRAKAPVAGLILLAVVVLAAAGIWPISVLAIAGAFAMVVTRCLSTQRAYRAVNWDIVVLIAGMIALGAAMEQTGLTQTLAGWIQRSTEVLSAELRPYVVLSAFFLLIAGISNVLSNNATALLFVPLVLQTAATLGVSNRPFLFCVAFASSTALCLPVGYQTHLLVYGPGGYKVRDFVVFGAPLTLILWVVASIGLPLIWPF